MRHMLSLLVLTIILRVWWSTGAYSYNGIVLGVYGDSCKLLVRLDSGEIKRINCGEFYKSKWVEVKAEREK